ncbi:DUF6731 family protein [Megasphaera massiliensis]|uniref:DUF6731 family protein n=2 Tax=Megasphaera massiliensis TaxID=1232428 RepID=UPI003AB64B12
MADLSVGSNNFTIDKNKKLEEVLKIMKDKPVSERRWNRRGDLVDNSIQLQTIEKLENGYWKLQFIKVRDEAMPGKINLDGVFTEIPLEENEYIGEDMTVIYAPDKHLVGVQRNFYSVSADGVAEYFSEIQPELQLIFQFEPLIDSKNISETSLIRSVEIVCDDLAGGALNDVIENVDTYGAKRMNLKISVGTRAKDAGLSQKVFKLVTRLRNEKSCRGLAVAYKEDINSPVSRIDLLDPKIEDKLVIPFSKIDKLTHDKIFFSYDTLL